MKFLKQLGIAGGKPLLRRREVKNEWRNRAEIIALGADFFKRKVVPLQQAEQGQLHRRERMGQMQAPGGVIHRLEQADGNRKLVTAHCLRGGLGGDGPGGRRSREVAGGLNPIEPVLGTAPITAAYDEARDLDEARDRLKLLLPCRVNHAVAEHRKRERATQNQTRAPYHLALGVE